MDELSPGARALLQAADTCDDPSADDAARVKSAVMLRVGAAGLTAAVVAVGSTQAKAASAASIVLKLTAAVAVAAGGVTAAWSYVDQPREATVLTAAPSQPPTPRPLATEAPEPAVSPPERLEPEEAPPIAKEVRARGAARLGPEKPKPQPTAADLDAEMKLIRGADAALRAGRSSEALGLLARHQAEHPQAALAHEREGLRAIAQCQNGAGGAAVLAERFIARSPRSPLAPRLRSACKIKPP